MFVNRIVYLVLLFVLTSCSTELHTKYKGAYEYVITNQSDFERTYLHESFGYVVGDLDIIGLKINGIDDLDKKKDYIVVMNHPIVKALTNSESIRNESGGNGKLKPIEVIVNRSIKTKHVYIYELDRQEYYRLLTP